MVPEECEYSEHLDFISLLEFIYFFYRNNDLGVQLLKPICHNPKYYEFNEEERKEEEQN